MVAPYPPPTPMQPPGAMMPLGAQTPLPAGLPFGAGPPSPPAPFGGPPSRIIDAEFRVLVDAATTALAPEPPPWHVPLGKPDPDLITAEATRQRDAHAQRVLTQAWMDMMLGMEIGAIFPADEPFVELKEIEPQNSQLLRIMHDAIVNFVAAQTITFSSLATGLVMKEERAAVEAKLADSIEEWANQHYREGQGDLIRTLTADALSGMVAVYHAPDPGDRRTGQRRYRVDPKVVFPVFGRDGLDRVYTVYDATYPEVLRDFGDGFDRQTNRPNPATRKIQQIARKGMGSGNARPDTEACHELIGYWDREYGVALWRGEVIREWHHQLWVCPWHVAVPNWRNNAGLKSHSPYLWTPGDTAPTDANGVRVGGSTRERDLARMHEPFLLPWVAVKDKFEKLLTRYMYAADRSLAEPLYWKRSSANSAIGAPEVKNWRDGVTEMEEDEEVDYLPRAPMTESFAPLWEMLQIEIQTAVPVPILQGQSIGTQASGNAIDAINDMGYAHFSPVVGFMPRMLGDMAHRELVYTRDYAPAYDPSDPLSGGFAVPTPTSYQVKLTREMLQRAGCYVKCEMSRFSLSGAAAQATTAAILDQQLHIGDRQLWIKKFGMSPRPLELEESRMVQDLEDSPGFVESRAIEYLVDQANQAAEMGDDESLLRLSVRGKRVAAKQTMHDMSVAKVAGMLPTQPEPMAGELPGGVGEPGGNPMPYLSAPEVGRSTGTEGGAPQTAAQPPLPGMS